MGLHGQKEIDACATAQYIGAVLQLNASILKSLDVAVLQKSQRHQQVAIAITANVQLMYAAITRWRRGFLLLDPSGRGGGIATQCHHGGRCRWLEGIAIDWHVEFRSTERQIH